jgi:hypothetical protein
MDASKVINGTWGEVWLDSDLVSEATSLQATVTLQKTKIAMCGKLAQDTKVTGVECKGTLKLLKTSSRMIQKVNDNLLKGKETVCTIVSALEDPDSFGAERLSISDAKFDQLTLMNWEAAKNGEESIPFTFTTWKFLDTITPQ